MMLSSLFLAGFLTAQVIAAPYTGLYQSPIRQVDVTPATTTFAPLWTPLARKHDSGNILGPRTIALERRGRGRYQTDKDVKVSDRDQVTSTLSPRIPVAETEAEAGRGIYQTGKTETSSDGEKKGPA